MKLSICCITYNHEKFVAKAIEGMVDQQTDFPYEIVIGEDGSTDKTRKICESYQAKFPAKIRVLPTTGNQGMMPNFIRTLDACTGQYKAICEGDDYWIDSKKLQKQVDFLEGHAEYNICFHRVYELFPHRPLKPETFNTSETGKDYSISDLAKGNFIPTASVVFRNHLFEQYPAWYPQSAVGDYVLHMLNARNGKIRYMPEMMAVYRRHPEGAWGMKKGEENSLRFIGVLDKLAGEFDGEVKTLLIKQKAALFSQLATINFYDRNVVKGRQYAEQAFALDPGLKERWLKEDYPNLLSNIFKSKRYRTADKLANYVKKLMPGE